MSGGIGTCKNPTCMQTDLLLEDGYCSDHCRMEATGCSVPGCECLGADDGVSRCSGCEAVHLGRRCWPLPGLPQRHPAGRVDRGSAMTALAGPTGAAAPKPVHRVECACSWVGYRRHPHSRPCPKCQAPAGTLRPVWLAGCAPRRGRCAYLAHISPQYKHAQHYGGFTTDLPTRWKDHLAGGYDPDTHRNHGKGARLLAAALHAGCQIELVRVWYGPQARLLEQRLKQRRKPGSLRAGARRSLKPLCPLCDQNAYRHYPQLPPAPSPPPTRFRHDPQVWNADREWDLAFPELAYGAAGA